MSAYYKGVDGLFSLKKERKIEFAYAESALSSRARIGLAGARPGNSAILLETGSCAFPGH